MEKLLKIKKGTMVHCPTEELANKVLSIADKLGYKWNSFEKFTKDNYWRVYEVNTYYDLFNGKFGCIKYGEQGDSIISAEDFIKLHTMDKNIYIKGNEKRANEVIKVLKDLGGKNLTMHGDCETGYYYINKRGVISCCNIDTNEAFLLEQAFKEYILPDKKETIVIGGTTYYKDEFEKAVKDLKPVKL